MQNDHVSIVFLNELLANNAVLLMQTLHYHWNIIGPEFHDYHILLDKQYHDLFEDMDLIAERVRAVQGRALGSMHEFLQQATLLEDHGPLPEPRVMIKRLHDQYLLFIAQMKKGVHLLDAETDDIGSRKMLEDLIEKYEKTNWMLRALLGKV